MDRHLEAAEAILGKYRVDLSPLETFAADYHLVNRKAIHASAISVESQMQATDFVRQKLAGQVLFFYSKYAVNEDGPLRDVTIIGRAQTVVPVALSKKMSELNTPDDMRANSYGLGLVVEPIEGMIFAPIAEVLVDLHGCAVLWDNLIMPISHNVLAAAQIPIISSTAPQE